MSQIELRHVNKSFGSVEVIRDVSLHVEAGQFTVRLNGDERAVGEKAAAGLFVRPE